MLKTSILKLIILIVMLSETICRLDEFNKEFFILSSFSYRILSLVSKMLEGQFPYKMCKQTPCVGRAFAFHRKLTALFLG